MSYHRSFALYEYSFTISKFSQSTIYIFSEVWWFLRIISLKNIFLLVMYSKIVGGKVEKRNYIPVRVEEEVCSGGDQQISNRLGV